MSFPRTPPNPSLPNDCGLVRLDQVQEAPVRWLWPNWMPLQKFTILDGDPGLGKSTLLLDIAARVSRGDAMPDGSPGVSGGVLLLTNEDGLADTVKPRLRVAGADFARIICRRAFGQGLNQRAPVLPDDLYKLVEDCRANQAKLVILDPLYGYVSSRVDSACDQHVRQVLQLVNQLAEVCDCAVVALRHLNKGRQFKAIYRGGGSIGIIAHARVGLLVAPDPREEQNRVLAVTKTNLGRKPKSLGFRLREVEPGHCKVSWLGQKDYEAADLIGGEFAPSNSKLEEATSFLREMLKDGARPEKEIEQTARKRKISKPTLDRAKKELNLKSHRINSGGGQGQGGWRFADGPNGAPGRPRSPCPLPPRGRGQGEGAASPNTAPKSWADILGQDFPLE
jgi:hypothetical protein